MTNEHDARCECGHQLFAHLGDDGPCGDCPCVEYEWDRVCSHCGNVHDPDISADIAEELS